MSENINQDNNVDVIEDDEIITLKDDNGTPVDFYEVAVVEYQDELYALLQPVEPMEGVEEDEAVIFKIIEGKNDGDEDTFEPVVDEKVLDAVFNEYIKAVADMDCCDDEDCDCHHHHDDDCDCHDEEEHEDGCCCGHHHKED